MNNQTDKWKGIRNNKGKSILIILYVLFVCIYPLRFLDAKIPSNIIDPQNLLVTNHVDESLRQDISLLKEQNISAISSKYSPLGPYPLSASDGKTLLTIFANSTDQINLISANVVTEKNATIYQVNYQISNNDPKYKYIIAEFQAEDAGSVIQLLDITAAEETLSVQERFGFDFSKQWVPLALSLGVTLFIVYTALRYIQKAEKAKWIPLLLILFLTAYFYISASKIGTTLGVSEFMEKTGEFGPWIFMIPFPLGSLGYYFMLWKSK
jgi:hypothetical protein